MRHVVMWLVATMFIVVPSTPALACGAAMFRDRPVVETPQKQLWALIRDGRLERARVQLATQAPHINPLLLAPRHVRMMDVSQRDGLHAVAVTHVRLRRHLHWSTQLLQALKRPNTPKISAHLAEAYVLTDDPLAQARGRGMLETLHAAGDLEDPYSLTMLAVLRFQRGDVDGGREALGDAERRRRPRGLRGLFGGMRSLDALGGLGQLGRGSGYGYGSRGFGAVKQPQM